VGLARTPLGAVAVAAAFSSVSPARVRVLLGGGTKVDEPAWLRVGRAVLWRIGLG
jgi:hypothetical protein